jgi:cyclic-di-GMP-binding protein
MPSFDAVSEIDGHEVTNAIDQANRELEQRFDFRGADAVYERDEKEAFVVLMKAQAEYQLKQMLDILRLRLAKRGIDVNCLEVKDIDKNLGGARQKVVLKHGIDHEVGKKVVKQLKDSGLKVQAQIQGDKVRVTGKKRDDLQEAMALLRKTELGVPLQFDNFRD